MLRAERLTVARGRRVLLEDFSLELEPSEALHVVGPNGCGKSSLLRVLAGVAEPRRGRVRRAARCVFIPERLALPDSLPARRWLRVTGASGGRLAPELDRRCGALSKGQLQRVALAGAIVDVDQRCLLVLDEPWAGLDATARAKLEADLAGAAARGAAVIYTDHSGAGALSATRSLALGRPTMLPPPSPDAEPVPAAARIELVRGNDRAALTVDDPELAARLADGWRIDRAEPLR